MGNYGYLSAKPHAVTRVDNTAYQITSTSQQITYNASGSLMSDAGRGMARIDYDLNNNPVRIQFTNGSVTRYIYSAAGEKLRATHLTAVPNISVAIGSTRELLPSEILNADSTDYLLGGSLTMRNGRIDKYQFDEGYCQATRYNNSQDNFTFYYYNRDHLGSIRQVTKADRITNGTVVQSMNYYPFGAQFCDGSTDSNVQPYKYNGKELDRMHGLDTYDYGARQYNPVTARWDRVDPLSEKYYSISPYAYCMGNPMKYIDPDGKGPWETFIFALKNPAISAQIGVILKNGNNISSIASRFASIGRTEEKSNAFRHTIWQAIITQIFGSEIAKEVGDAHEKNPKANLSQRYFCGPKAKEESDQVTDLLNNNLGREIGKTFSGNIKSLVSYVINIFSNEGLYVNEENKSDNSFHVIRKKISQEEIKC